MGDFFKMMSIRDQDYTILPSALGNVTAVSTGTGTTWFSDTLSRDQKNPTVIDGDIVVFGNIIKVITLTEGNSEKLKGLATILLKLGYTRNEDFYISGTRLGVRESVMTNPDAINKIFDFLVGD